MGVVRAWEALPISSRERFCTAQVFVSVLKGRGLMWWKGNAVAGKKQPEISPGAAKQY